MQSKSKFIVLTLVLAFIFLLGFVLGNYFSSLDPTTSKILKESELNAESFLIEQQLIETLGSNCAFSQTRLSALSEQLWKLGKLLNEEVSREELDESKFDLLKRKFHLMQIKTYALYRKIEQTCGKEFDVILFYFKRNSSESKEQGEILDEIVGEFDTKVFAIEFDYSPELTFLEEYHNVTSAPTLVINFETRLEGLQDYEIIEKKLKKNEKR